MKKISPILAAVANVVLPGLAYILVGKRKVFGWLLVANSILVYAWMYLYPNVVTPGLWGPSEFSSPLGIAALLALSAAFAYDAYQLANER
jgi:hypothetical protein